jgi:hypothetical protein
MMSLFYLEVMHSYAVIIIIIIIIIIIREN